ncbi:polysaccharide biosynthesis protein [Gluconobacter cerinus]|uniref:Polysaccharide biosynthesis protein CapD n=1 Tax=Gluconobacter cerinus TaxID=38307 RepID=A0AAV5NFW6_9PROT|nr:polysaccharide biosynthesis protein [Gluconobacter cerinus]MBS1039425.1 polysaccharide biosynthesis protein [Gluconobacter cerinus]MBS1046400.1 polysaccharide biosynthesis protein [Gluconobacter cerinus]GLQ62673.1 polysaccharide biosynthesis protein CapD [Gluconobacter cerinus]
MKVTPSSGPQFPAPSSAISRTGRTTAQARRIALNVLLDGVVSAAAAPVARWLADPHGGLLHPLWFVAGGGITLLVSGLPFRMAQQYWRFSGLSDLFNIACASVVSATLFSTLLHLAGYPLPSTTFPVIHALVLLTCLGALRMFWRLTARRRLMVAERERVLLLGADHEADLFIRAMERDHQAGRRVVGLLTGGTQQAGRRIHSCPILGTIDETPEILKQMSASGRLPDTLVITTSELRGAPLSRILEVAREYGVDVQRTPSLTDLKPADSVELRPVAIEDLLNRPPVALNSEGMSRLIAGQVIAVTGAGGSIGSELARQIASFRPAAILLIENSEYALWQINLDLSERYPAVQRHQIIADVRDRGRISEIFMEYRPALIFHAAALKHVPIVESNPIEGVLTNVVGTRIVLDEAERSGAQAMVMISTDKAVNPSSLMGASKRCAEVYGQALDMRARAGKGGLRCVTVRFGNVLGSTGSVVPLFRRQLEHGGPLTVTHPDMTRYFMTIPEAVGLVLQAAVRGTQDACGEDTTDQRLRQGGIFVLDMGDPVRIMDLACQMIRLAGLKPETDVEIQITGLRPGEKLFEELFHGREAPVPTDAPGLRMASPRTVDFNIATDAMNALEAACHREDLSAVMEIFHRLVPEFNHNRDGKAPSAVALSQPDAEVTA